MSIGLKAGGRFEALGSQMPSRPKEFYPAATRPLLAQPVRSTGCPAWTQASMPPRSGRIFLNPACLRCFAAVAADSSFGARAVHDNLHVTGISLQGRIDIRWIR